MHPADPNAITDLDALRAAVLAERAATLAERAARESLQATLDEHRTALAAQQQALAARDAQIKRRDQRIEHLSHMIAMLRRQQFAARSERFDPAQQALFEATCAEDIASAEAELETLAPAAPVSAVETPAQNRPRRQPLPADLPRVEKRIEPETCTCGTCGGSLHCIGEEVSEKLDIKPVEFFVRRVVRPKYACRQCEIVVTAPTLPAVIERGIAAPGLLAHVAVSKYVDHQPLTRQQVICGRSGIDLPVSTQAEWMGAIGHALQPLIAVLRADLHGAAVIHADETPVQILNAAGSKAKGSHGKGKTRTGYLFTYRRGESEQPPIIVYDFAENRRGENASRFLDQYAGALVVDDYVGYKTLFAQTDDTGRLRIRELACWAHARRKFFELHAANGSEIGAEVLRRIGELYKVERDAKEFDPPDRHAHRQTHARPLVDGLLAWLTQQRPTISEGSATAKAFDYILRRQAAFVAYLDDGRYPIDNNPVENAIRPIALGRKNWLFAGSLQAGQRAANIMSLLHTARANGLDPFVYLRDVLERLPTTPASRIRELLPYRKAPANG